MLHHRGNGDGCHHQNGGNIKLGHVAGEIRKEGLQTNQFCTAHTGEVQHRAHIAGGQIRNHRCAAGIGNQSHAIGTDHAQQNGNDFHHALAPDIGRYDDSHCHQSQPPAGFGIVHGRRRQIQTDQNDNRSGYHRGQKPHHAMYAHGFNNQRQNHIQQARHNNAAAGILQFLRTGHGCIDAAIHCANGCKSAQKCKGRAQERGHLELGAKMEKQGAQTCKEQGCLNGQRQSVGIDQNGDQHCCTEHGKHVLQAQGQHFRQTQGPRVLNWFSVTR